MATQTISTTGEIPEFLQEFYTGTEAQPERGLIPRGIAEIYPEGLTAQQAYAKKFQPLIEQGLIGAGSIAPMSQFQ